MCILMAYLKPYLIEKSTQLLITWKALRILFVGISEKQRGKTPLCKKKKKKSLKLWLRGLSNGSMDHEVEALLTKFIRMVKVTNVFSFVILSYMRDYQ